MIDHHTLQVESPDEVAAQIRAALKFIPPERLVISSDCGMGREGMSRRHAYYKMVSLVLGTNMVRKELGFPEAQCLLLTSAIRWWCRRNKPCACPSVLRLEIRALYVAMPVTVVRARLTAMPNGGSWRTESPGYHRG